MRKKKETCIDCGRQLMKDEIALNKKLIDLWKHRNHSIKRSRVEARDINSAIRNLAEALKGEKLSGSRWLLLYEVRVNKLIDDEFLPDIEMDDFFQKLFSLSISFYMGVSEN